MVYATAHVRSEEHVGNTEGGACLNAELVPVAFCSIQDSCQQPRIVRPHCSKEFCFADAAAW